MPGTGVNGLQSGVDPTEWCGVCMEGSLGLGEIFQSQKGLDDYGTTMELEIDVFDVSHRKSLSSSICT